MKLIRDRRFWDRATYSVQIGDTFLYCGIRDVNGREVTSFAIFKGKTEGSPSLYQQHSVPLPLLYISKGTFTSVEEARKAAEDYFYTGREAEPIDLCPECFTRHKPHENDLCQL